jgi:hypothetical protein
VRLVVVIPDEVVGFELGRDPAPVIGVLIRQGALYHGPVVAAAAVIVAVEDDRLPLARDVSDDALDMGEVGIVQGTAKGALQPRPQEREPDARERGEREQAVEPAVIRIGIVLVDRAGLDCGENPPSPTLTNNLKPDGDGTGAGVGVGVGIGAGTAFLVRTI